MSEQNESSFVSLLSFLIKQAYKITCCAWVRASVSQHFSQLTTFHEIWYKRYATGRYCNLIPSSVPNVLQSVIEKSQPLNTGTWKYIWQCIWQYANLYKVSVLAMGTGSFPGVKRPGRGADHPPPSKRQGHERVELYLYSPSGPSWPVMGRALLYMQSNKIHKVF